MKRKLNISRIAAVLGIIGGSTLTTNASATEPFYVGLQAGYENIGQPLAEGPGSEQDKTIKGPLIGGVLGAELRWSFGYAALEINVSDSNAEYSKTTRQNNGSFQSETATSDIGAGISSMLGVNITTGTSIYGIAGYLRQTIKFEARDFDVATNQVTDVETDEVFGGMRFGLGLHHELYDLVGVRLEVTRTEFDEETVSLLQEKDIKPTQDRITIGVIGRF